MMRGPHAAVAFPRGQWPVDPRSLDLDPRMAGHGTQVLPRSLDLWTGPMISDNPWGLFGDYKIPPVHEIAAGPEETRRRMLIQMLLSGKSP